MPEKLIFVLLCSLLLMCSCDKKKLPLTTYFLQLSFKLKIIHLKMIFTGILEL